MAERVGVLEFVLFFRINVSSCFLSSCCLWNIWGRSVFFLISDRVDLFQIEFGF